MDIKIFFAILASVIGIIAFIPYLRDIFTYKTKPHAYTWLIWIITQGTAVVAMFYGGAIWGMLSLAIGLIFILFIFLSSLKFGTKDITRSDTIVLIFALLSIVVWWQLKQPLLSVIMISVIDMCGFFPTFRKTYKDPWSETLSSWGLFIISNFLAILAMNEYNFFTLFYILIINTANIVLFVIAIIRRKIIKKEVL